MCINFTVTMRENCPVWYCSPTLYVWLSWLQGAWFCVPNIQRNPEEQKNNQWLSWKQNQRPCVIPLHWPIAKIKATLKSTKMARYDKQKPRSWRPNRSPTAYYIQYDKWFLKLQTIIAFWDRGGILNQNYKYIFCYQLLYYEFHISVTNNNYKSPF